MRNIKLTLEYDGTDYSGWQSQTNARAIQDVVTEAIIKMVEHPVILRGASRTDAGVHALGQVAVFQTERDIPCNGFLGGINSNLPEDIRVIGCEEVPLDFHPIRNAKRKIYRYLIEFRRVASPLWRNRVWSLTTPLDLEAMREASRFLIGEHDFKSFQGANSEVEATVRNLESITIEPEDFLVFEFTGNGFLKHMVRNIVGTLVAVGEGKLAPADVKKILEAKDRTKAGCCAPASGLYLVQVEY